MWDTDSLAPATEKGQKRLNWVAPLGCQAAACFLGNRGVWLAARPCSVESHRIEANLNITPFLSLPPSHAHLTAETDTWSRITSQHRYSHIWTYRPGCSACMWKYAQHARVQTHIQTRLPTVRLIQLFPPCSSLFAWWIMCRCTVVEQQQQEHVYLSHATCQFNNTVVKLELETTPTLSMVQNLYKKL